MLFNKQIKQLKIINDLIQIHIQRQGPKVSLYVRGGRTQRMSENMSTSCKDTYQSETCSKREQLIVVFQQCGAWPVQCCTFSDLVGSTKTTRLIIIIKDFLFYM